MERTKYPRTFHLPWSPGATSDDKMLQNTDHFLGQEIVVTEKMDGENTSIYSDGYLHARSMSSKDHPSRHLLKNLAGRLAVDMPVGLRICGENLFAKHSILYYQLPSSFLVFSIWQETQCLSWNETVEMAELFGLHTVPVLYRGLWSQQKVQDCLSGSSQCSGEQEGYVVRIAREFDLTAFKQSVAKFVRAHHVQTDEHWMQSKMIKNVVI